MNKTYVTQKGYVSPSTTPNFRSKLFSLLTILGLMFITFTTFANPTPALAVPMGVEDFSFDELTVNAELSKNTENQSVLRVEEKYVTNFATPNQNKGIVVMLPKVWNKGEYILHLNIEGVYDENNNRVYYTFDENSEGVTLYVDDDTYKTGVHTYVVKWSAQGVTGFFEESQTEEFYWNLITGNRPQPVNTATVNLTIDEKLMSALTGNNVCYFGALKSSTQCDITQTGNTFSAQVEPLQKHGGVTLAVGFQKGTFATPDINPTKNIVVGGFVLVGGIMLGSVIAIITRIVKHKKNVKNLGIKGKPVIAEYEPPKGWSVLEGATMLGKAHSFPVTEEKTLAATVLELALNNNLQITQQNNEMLLTRQNNTPRNSVLNEVFTKIFATKLTVEAKDLTPLTPITTKVEKELVNKNFFHIVKTKIPAWLWILPILIGGAFYIFVPNIFAIAATLAAAAGLGLFYLLIFNINIHTPTQTGYDAIIHLLGLKHYIEVAEEDRIKMLQSVKGADSKMLNNTEIIHLYEKLLPWAVLFGLEKSWIKVIGARFEQLTAEERNIYQQNNFAPYYVAAIPLLVTSTRDAVSSYNAANASTSGSGGSMGGGFSGGGGGGGSVGGR